MAFARWALLAALLLGVGLVSGCEYRSTGMQNMKPGTAPTDQRDLPTGKGGRPVLPRDPPDPMAPPR